ncbi:MAG TPA: hypothetical protein VM638_01300 [Actinomycetota bacterium]|nr:hypothetical protein [Actinomycetota bacterium]
MAMFGVARAEELPGVMEGEVRRINLGEFLVVELTDEAARGFPGDVFGSEEEAQEAAAREAGVVANQPGEVDPPGQQA